MRRSLPVLLAAGLLLLTACGSQAGGPRAAVAPSGTSACGVPIGGSPSVRPGSPSERERDGVRITGIGPACAEFEVTNRESEPLSYTVTFTHLSASGAAQSTSTETVPAVAPGRTVGGTVARAGMAAGSGGTGRVAIATVRSVPTAESSEPGVCPPSGMRVSADRGDAAMGLRAVGLHLENCGTGTVELNGYPELQVVGQDHKPVDGVQILHGGSAISTGAGADDPPRPLALKPGERAYAGLVWRNTVELGQADPVNAPYLRVRAKAGAAPVMVVPELDLGTTGRLGVGAWTVDRSPVAPARP
ncbi:DUF4232 domain-containing protein [Kitasatospora sp. NPDC002040]|uniref:DUF4232 domain-containing protein n=1 Tax=Kitasatospora sp. NPDC002040 TaxID=3154661 RepID=UPI0033249663